MGKEPWNFSRDTERTAADFLRLRHRMIPYIYSMNRLTEKDGMVVDNSNVLQKGDIVTIRFFESSAKAEIVSVEENS